MDIGKELAREEYNALSYNARSWIRLRTVCAAGLVLGICALVCHLMLY